MEAPAAAHGNGLQFCQDLEYYSSLSAHSLKIIRSKLTWGTPRNRTAGGKIGTSIWRKASIKPVKVDGWKRTPIEVTLLVKSLITILKPWRRIADIMTVHLCGLYSQTLLCRNSSTNVPKGEFYRLLSNQNILLSWSESSCLFFPPRLSMKRPSTATAPATCTTAATSPFELRGVVWATVHSITPKALRPSSHTALESRSAMYFAGT